MLFASAAHVVEGEYTEANEFDQRDAFIQGQSDGSAVCLVKLLFEVDLGDLTGESRFVLLLVVLQLFEGLFVGGAGFPESRPRERLLCELTAQLGESVERFA
jgi:hypothetical protein